MIKKIINLLKKIKCKIALACVCCKSKCNANLGDDPINI